MCVFVGLRSKSVLSSPSISFIFTSKEITSSFEYSAVNFIVEWNVLTCTIKTQRFQRFFTMLPNEKDIIYIPPPKHWFLFKTFEHFFVKICHDKNSIRRDKLRYYCGSTFLLESAFIKFKYVILRDYFHKFCQSIT